MTISPRNVANVRNVRSSRRDTGEALSNFDQRWYFTNNPMGYNRDIMGVNQQWRVVCPPKAMSTNDDQRSGTFGTCSEKSLLASPRIVGLLGRDRTWPLQVWSIWFRPSRLWLPSEGWASSNLYLGRRPKPQEIRQSLTVKQRPCHSLPNHHSNLHRWDEDLFTGYLELLGFHVVAQSVSDNFQKCLVVLG